MFLCASTQLESFLSHKKLEKSFKLLVFILEYGHNRKFLMANLPTAYCLLVLPTDQNAASSRFRSFDRMPNF